MNKKHKNNLINREDWLKNTLGKLQKKSKILDAGAGELQYKKYCNHLKYTSQDFGLYDGKGDKNALQTKEWDNTKLDIISDIIDIPVEDNSFDNIMCIEVLEHLPHPSKAIKEFSRILKPNGKLILTAPFCSMTHFSPFFYCTGFSKYWYEKILTENNFKIIELKFNGNYFDYIIQEIRRLPLMEERYSNAKITKKIIYKIASRILLKFLESLSKNNENSEEAMCFGLNILAIKK